MLRFLTNRLRTRRAPSEDASKDGSPADEPARPTVRLPGRGSAADYARLLLHDLGVETESSRDSFDPHPAHEWAASGAMALTGLADGSPELAPGPLASATRGAFRAIGALAPDASTSANTARAAALAGIDAPALLGERAAIAGLRRRGRISAGGACRLIATRDGFIALQLARPEDTALIPAWLECGPVEDAWTTVGKGAALRPTHELVERGRWMGLPVAPVWPAQRDIPPWLRLDAEGAHRKPADPVPQAPKVLDLSSLWAGPLCAQLLAQVGGDVVKVESAERPDAARFGPRAFFDSLNENKRSVVLRLSTEEGKDALRALIDAADIVVESARPRGLEQLGIVARDHLARRAGLTWVSITAYGRPTPRGDWVGFGDDAGAAAGLAAATGPREARPLFCGDAIADPLTGLHAALAALGSQRAGGGHLLDVSLCGVASRALHFPVDAEPARITGSRGQFAVEAGGVSVPVAPPRVARRPGGGAVELGADTRDVLAEVGAC